MSGAMVLTADQLEQTAGFLRKITAASQEHGVMLAPYGRTELRIGESTISFQWDSPTSQYVLDDQVGT